MRSLFRILFLLMVLPGLISLIGCKKAEEPVEEVEPWPPVGTGEGTESGTAVGPDGQPVIVDTAYIVVEKRQSGGELVPGGTSKLGGRPPMVRTELESMIIVEGDKTGARSAYLLPPTDYMVVQVGHHLQKSTLSRWESTDEDHIPAPPPPEEPTQRSRTGGAAENYVY